ncbi:hypothetical protein MTO96_008527 [Rhipicephalus appendiculatus]
MDGAAASPLSRLVVAASAMQRGLINAPTGLRAASHAQLDTRHLRLDIAEKGGSERREAEICNKTNEVWRRHFFYAIT